MREILLWFLAHPIALWVLAAIPSVAVWYTIDYVLRDFRVNPAPFIMLGFAAGYYLRKLVE